MSVEENKAILMGEMLHPAGDRVAVVQFHDGSVTLFALPKKDSLAEFVRLTDTRQPTYEDFISFNQAIAGALAGMDRQCGEFPLDVLISLYDFAVNTTQDLEAARYDSTR